MSKDTQDLTTLQMLERINQAIADSGIDQIHAERKPVDIFRRLVGDWYISKDSSWQNKDESEILPLLVQKHTLAQLQKAIRKIYSETLELSMAHQTLSAWTRRELEQEFLRMQTLIENNNSKHKDFG